MQRRILGRTGLEVAPLALGGATFGYVNRASGWDPYIDEGRRAVHKTIGRALDLGLNLFDTSPAYGDGHSETLFGEVMKTRRHECVLASKVRFNKDRQAAIDSVHESLNRLQTDHIDVMQVHGSMYSQADYANIVREGGLLEALCLLRQQGKIGHIGITAEEPWTLIPFLAHKEIDLYQIHYNLIHQGAGRHFLIEAAKENVGILTMRTMTAGIFQLQMSFIAPEWEAAHGLGDANIKFVLSDSRVHAGIVGMRGPQEVERNVASIVGWEPPVDVATLPRYMFEMYDRQDGR